MEIGDLVRALRGRDAGRIFLVIGIAPLRVRLADGTLRPVARPKEKNVRHVETVGRAPEELRERLASGHRPMDQEIRALLKALEGGDAGAEG